MRVWCSTTTVFTRRCAEAAVPLNAFELEHSSNALGASAASGEAAALSTATAEVQLCSATGEDWIEVQRQLGTCLVPHQRHANAWARGQQAGCFMLQTQILLPIDLGGEQCQLHSKLLQCN